MKRNTFFCKQCHNILKPLSQDRGFISWEGHCHITVLGIFDR